MNLACFLSWPLPWMTVRPTAVTLEEAVLVGPGFAAAPAVAVEAAAVMYVLGVVALVVEAVSAAAAPLAAVSVPTEALALLSVGQVPDQCFWHRPKRMRTAVAQTQQISSSELRMDRYRRLSMCDRQLPRLVHSLSRATPTQRARLPSEERLPGLVPRRRHHEDPMVAQKRPRRNSRAGVRMLFLVPLRTWSVLLLLLPPTLQLPLMNLLLWDCLFQRYAWFAKS